MRACRDNMEVAADEVFSPVDESTASEPEAGVASADANAATFEGSPEAANGSEPVDQGSYIDVATVSEEVPPSGGAPIDIGASSSDATSLDAPPTSAASAHAPNSGLSPQAHQMQHPSYERGQPPVCPIVIVRVADDQMEQLVTETRKRVARECANACQDVARQKIHQEFWRRNCEERAILGH